MTREILVVQHVQVEGLGTVADALAEGGYQPRFVRSHAGDRVPREAGAAAGLIVMGGPMGVYDADRFPSLRDEMRLIEHTLASGKPILGICLGSQLLAHVLGAPVTPSGGKEIGWCRIRLTPEASRDPLWQGIDPDQVVFQWHGDIFPLPTGAVNLATSSFTSCQAYRHGSAYGFLFHLEATEPIVREMVRQWPEELVEAGVEGREVVEQAPARLTGMAPLAGVVFGRWVEQVGKKGN